MLIYNGEKFACLQCIRGHRSSSCYHENRLLFLVRKRGRPQINDELRVAIVPDAGKSPAQNDPPPLVVNGSSRNAIILDPDQYQMQLVDSEGNRVKVLDPPIIPSSDFQPSADENSIKPEPGLDGSYEQALNANANANSNVNVNGNHVSLENVAQKPSDDSKAHGRAPGSSAKRARLRLRTVRDAGPGNKMKATRKSSVPIHTPSPDDEYVFVPAGNGLYRRELRSVVFQQEHEHENEHDQDEHHKTNSGSGSGCCSSSVSSTSNSSSSIGTSSGYATNENRIGPGNDCNPSLRVGGPAESTELPDGMFELAGKTLAKIGGNPSSSVDVSDIHPSHSQSHPQAHHPQDNLNQTHHESDALGLADLAENYNLGMMDTPFLIAPMHMNGMIFSNIRGLDDRPWTPEPDPNPEPEPVLELDPTSQPQPILKGSRTVQDQRHLLNGSGKGPGGFQTHIGGGEEEEEAAAAAAAGDAHVPTSRSTARLSASANHMQSETKARVLADQPPLGAHANAGSQNHHPNQHPSLHHHQKEQEAKFETTSINNAHGVISAAEEANAQDNLEPWINTFDRPTQDDEIYDIYFAASCVLPGQCHCGDECECYGCPTHNPLPPAGAGAGADIRVESANINHGN